MTLLGRVAGAPISWGVCEVPGWGVRLPADRVLAEMRSLGLAACEYGPDGFLPAEPARAALLAANGLRPVGGFVPAVLHDAGHDPLPELVRVMDAFSAAEATVLVLAAVTGQDGYDQRPELTEAQWATLLGNLDRVASAAAGRRLTPVLHPHIGTVVECATEVHRVVGGSRIHLCLDTGHLLLGGTDPIELAAEAPSRIGHVHLKDVDQGVADRVRSGLLSYTSGVRNGLYRPLGAGAVDIAALVTGLERAGYRGWYVLEQDTVLDAEPPAGAGPVADVRASLDYLVGLS